jgi:hypothetical protein
MSFDADGLTPVNPFSPSPNALAEFDVMDLAVDGYADLTGITLDRATLVAMRHGIALGQALHIGWYTSRPGDPEFASDVVASYGALVFLLDRRIKGAP